MQQNHTISFRARQYIPELMDDLSMSGAELLDTLDKLDRINYWLGGEQVVMGGLKKFAHLIDSNKEIVIIDLGCGSGEMLRVIAEQMRKKNQPVRLIGIDANPHIVEYAKKKSRNYPEISYRCTLITPQEISNSTCDIFLSTLFLHHFKSDDCIEFITAACERATMGVIVNDLHRSRMAYYLFKFMSIFISNKMIKSDGLTSILRGFKMQDLRRFSKSIPQAKYSIEWCWAFRYRWIIYSKLRQIHG